MRADARLALIALSLSIASPKLHAQSQANGPVLGARRLAPNAPLKIWLPAGELRLIAWDRDSVVVRGRVIRPGNFFFGGDSTGMKFGVEQPGSGRGSGKGTLVAYIPRHSKVSVKTVSARIDGNGVAGWFYTVSGLVSLRGAATSLAVESMSGGVYVDAVTPWLRARTGDGALTVRGIAQDVDAASIGGTLDIAATGMMRGQFASVTGDIHYVGSPAAGGIFEFTNHSGGVVLLLPPNAAGVFALSSIEGNIVNGFAPARPTGGVTRSMRIALGRGTGAQVTVRTFKGPISILPQ